MAIIRRKELHGMSDAQRKAKIAELEKAMLELRGEGRKDKVKPLKKAIAKLLTPPPKRETKSQPTPQSSKAPQSAPSRHPAGPAATTQVKPQVGQGLGHGREAGLGPTAEPLKSAKTK